MLWVDEAVVENSREQVENRGQTTFNMFRGQK
jgi:hypothetical protein